MPESSSTARNARAAAVPAELTRFIGRSRELAELGPLLQSARLLTLTGPGGSGKTRLAAELVTRVADRYAQVAWVDLAPLSDGALVRLRVTAALDVAERPGVPTVTALLDALADRAVLVVLDNCEHLVGAVADLVDPLLRGAPRLTILATSRAALGLSGETAWLVPSLATTEAVQLFVDRAQAVLPSFAVGTTQRPTIEGICRRLDGMPLAIELAAARVRALLPEQIAERLGDAFKLLSGGGRTALPRQRTLRGTMDWSYGLLSERERVLLGRLSVFAGSFGLDAAESICAGGSLEEEDILDGVAALVDQSLVIMEGGEGEARYRLLETVRQYAGERLREAGVADAVRARHAAFFLELAERAEPHLFAGAGDPGWHARIRAEFDNLRAAAIWAEEDPARTETGLRIAIAIHWFWFATGQFREGRHRITRALETSSGVDPLIRGRALVTLSMVAFWQGDVRSTLAPAEQALPLLRAAGDRFRLAYGLVALGSAAVVAGRPADALAALDEALSLVESPEPPVIVGFALQWKGRAAAGLGQLDVARAAFERAAAIGRRHRHRPAVAHALGLCGRVAFLERRYEEAKAHYAESIALHHETDEGWGLAYGLEGMAGVALATGRYDRGVRLAAAAARVRERIATALTPAEQAEIEASLAAARQSMGSRFDDAWAKGRALTTVQAVELACSDRSGLTAEVTVPLLDQQPVGSVSKAPDEADLRVLALGPLQVFRRGTAVDSTSWGSARPRELLVFLLMHPAGWTKEDVGLALWPEASASQLRNSFHVTLHRLRKALGNPDWVVQHNERYLIDRSLGVEFDVERFEREAAEAVRAVAGGDGGAVAPLERALALYRGDFLDGEPAGDWHLIHRDHFRRVFADSSMVLGEYHQKADRPAKAAEIYRRVLLRDELRETAWRALMVSLARLGERAQAVRLYQQLRTVLDQELGTGPATETATVYQRIERGDPV